MEPIILSTNILQHNSDKRRFDKLIAALQKLLNILNAHGVRLSFSLAEDVLMNCILIRDKVKAAKIKTIGDQPDVVRRMAENQVEEEMRSMLIEIESLKDHLSNLHEFSELIDFAKAMPIQEAEFELRKRNSLTICTEEGSGLYRKHLECKALMQELVQNMNPLFRTSFIESMKYDYQTKEVYLEPFDYDSSLS